MSETSSFAADYYWKRLSSFAEGATLAQLVNTTSVKRERQLRQFLERYPNIFSVSDYHHPPRVLLRSTFPRPTPKEFNAEFVRSKTKIVTTIQECDRFVRKQISSRSILGFDCEGVNFASYNGRITLMQFSTMDKEVFLFDVHQYPWLVDDGGLRRLLESSDVIKVVHDCSGDAATLLTDLNIRINRVFDTQSCFTVLLSHETRVPAVSNILIGLNNLCSLRGVPTNKDKAAMGFYVWGERPLTNEMIYYAAADVLALVPYLFSSLYRDLVRLPVDHQLLFDDLCIDQVWQKVDPAGVTRAKKTRLQRSEQGVTPYSSTYSSNARSSQLADEDFPLPIRITAADIKAACRPPPATFEYVRSVERLNEDSFRADGRADLHSTSPTNVTTSENSFFAADFYWTRLSTLGKGFGDYLIGNLIESGDFGRSWRLLRFLERFPDMFAITYRYDPYDAGDWVCDLIPMVSLRYPDSPNPRLISNDFDMDFVRIKTKIVTSIKDCERFVKDQIASSAVLGFDCEGRSHGSGNGQITLMQFSTMDKRVYLFDVQEYPQLVEQGGLRKLLESASVTKVVHDCSGDAANLRTQHDIRIKRVFDTQSCFTVLLSHETKVAALSTIGIGLNELCTLRGVPTHKVEAAMSHHIWGNRPLTKEMIAYAAADVLALVPYLYSSFIQDLYHLPHDDRKLFDDLCVEQVLQKIDPPSAARAKKLRLQQSSGGSVPESASLFSDYSSLAVNLRDNAAKEIPKRVNRDDVQAACRPPPLIDWSGIYNWLLEPSPPPTVSDFVTGGIVFLGIVAYIGYQRNIAGA